MPLNPNRPDPNRDRNDPMVSEHWMLGEAFQDAVREAGYEADAVEGIAVDVHDLLQAAETVRELLEAGLADRAALVESLARLRFEFDHIRWHCDSAVAYLDEAAEALAP